MYMKMVAKMVQKRYKSKIMQLDILSSLERNHVHEVNFGEPKGGKYLELW